MDLNEMDSLDRMILCKYIHTNGFSLVGHELVIQIDTDTDYLHIYTFYIILSLPTPNH